MPPRNHRLRKVFLDSPSLALNCTPRQCYYRIIAAKRATIVLAAGASERMGTNKALLPWAGTTLLGYAVEQARAAGAQDVVVVLGPTTSQIEINARVVLNPDPATGRSASIRLGAAALAHGVDAIIVQSVDQPVPGEVLRLLFAAIAPEIDVVVPTYESRRGHPVAFSGRLLPELREVNEADQGLRAVVRRYMARLKEVPVDTDAVLFNLNDPAAYAAVAAREC